MFKKFTLTPIAIFLISIPLLVIAFYTYTAFYYPKAYVMGTYEDLYGEWAQTYGFVITCIFSTLMACQKQHSQRWFFMLLATASFFSVMEEISWGQRLIGFETPEFFHDNSYQDEANVHNLLTGPVEVWTKTFLTHVISLGLIVYGVLLPIALRLNFQPALRLSQWRICAAPPLSLSLTFIAAAFLEGEWFSFNEAEVAELLVAWALAFTAFAYWLEDYEKFKNSLLAYCGVLVVGILAVWATTTYLLHTPAQRAEIESRLANGYEKFADRYEGYDYAYGVAESLELYDELRPNNTVILRKIADNLEVLGETEKAKVFIEKAVAEGLRRIKEDESNVQALVSLAKSYRKLSDYDATAVYAQKAYQLALTKQKDNPDDAYWAYWLAKACEQVNRQQDALSFYRKAHQLDPNSSRYEQAYQQKKEIMIDYEN